MTGSPQRSTAIPDTAVVAGVAAILGCAHLVFPFGRDQAEYAYGAARLLDGGALYRDVFCIKPPLTHGVHALALMLFGSSMTSIRILDVLWQTLTALVVAGLGRKLDGRRSTGLLAAIVYLVAYFAHDFFHAAETDGFLTLPLAVGIWSVLEGIERRRDGFLLLGGALLGAAALFKYPIGLLVVLLVPVMRGGNGSWRPVVLAVSGFALALAACVVALAASGALVPFVETLELLPRYVLDNPGATTHPASGALGFLRLPWCLFALAFAIEAAAYARGPRDPRRLALLAWWVAALLHLVLQNKYWAYHWLPLLAPSALLLVCAIRRVCDLAISDAARRACAVVALALAASTAWWIAKYPSGYRALWAVVSGGRSLEEGWAGFHVRNYRVGTELAAARWIREHSAPDDTVFVWGYQPAVYFLSGRRCASRFVFDYFLVPEHGWPKAFRDEAIETLRARPPRVLVVVHNPEKPLALLDGLGDLLASSYTLGRSIDNFDMYERRADSIRAPPAAR